MYDDVLVPTDGGDRMEQVTERAVETASQHEATLHALSVIDDRAFLTLDDDLQTDVAETFQRTAEETVAAVAALAERAGVDVVTAVREGRPGEQIRTYAAEADVDLIVIGSRGADSYEGSMLGSVSQDVVTNAERPVLTLPLEE
jgi:nucleotide-binding universal stress UspA family protein